MKDSHATRPSPRLAFDDSLRLARALGALVLLLRAEPADEADARELMRRAVRAVAAAARVASLDLRLVDGTLHLAGRALAPDSPHRDAALDALVEGLTRHGSFSLDVRRGAAPAELLELARVLGTVQVAASDDGAWRSWSVRITPRSSPVVPPPVRLPEAVQHELDRLHTARDDDAMRPVVSALLRLASDSPWSQSPPVLQAIAIGLVGEARRRGSRGGRLALEGGVRVLLSPERIGLLVSSVRTSAARDALLPVLARGGDLSVRTLVHALQDAETLAERRVCFDAIVALDAGAGALRDALGDPRWFVVRNAAALLGEMGVAEADGQLEALLDHDDERIRVAAGRALIRIGTERALLALQRRLGDPAAELRRLAAAAHGGRSQGKPSTAALLEALDVETEEEVMLEIVAVLGALGSPDGVQRLVRLLRGTGEEAPPWLREAAYDALVAARGSGVLKMLES